MKKPTEREVDVAVWKLFTSPEVDSEEAERLAQKALTAIKQGTELPTQIRESIENYKHSNDSND